MKLPVSSSRHVLVEKILDTAGQKGTGKWTAMSALETGIPLTLIAEAVLARFLSALKDPHPRRIVFLVVSGVAILVALVATYTRGSWVGFACGALWLLRRRWAALFSLLVVATLGSGVDSPTSLQQ